MESYGGFLSVWAVTHDQRFKAAMVGAGPIDWSSSDGGEIPFFLILYLGYDPMTWFKMSPLKYIKNAKTPILIQQGMADKQVSLCQSLELKYALKSLKVPYKAIFYPKQTHSIDSPKQAYAAMNDQVDWVKKYIEPY
ncbi:MAG: hypothetical protein A3G78_07465 [Alphaproteobacteria bacterium RIFCSPLOWO2_12_FULL_42_29]|nr:MAG: Dipeptidyl aminopeptidase/acylaminoacyl peptidase [Parcubacteria group bacterium GW2011_GWC2_44_22]OFX09006.1 MAG: hypothetical protein A3G78_07465 [Alphaproteobacteria bacterium RIFCSPLOWO2_12_FULL_42_29]